MANRDPAPRSEDTGTNTALVVVVVILIAALIGVFIWWGTNDDDEVEIDLPGDDVGLVESAPSSVAAIAPPNLWIPQG